jgi:hypothetical protein
MVHCTVLFTFLGIALYERGSLSSLRAGIPSGIPTSVRLSNESDISTTSTARAFKPTNYWFAVLEPDPATAPSLQVAVNNMAPNVADPTQGLNHMLQHHHAAVSAYSLAPPADLSAIKLGALLGTGSFARVYRGKWQRQLVAVKVMDPPAPTAGAGADAATTRAALLEAALAKDLTHPNIVKTLDFAIAPPAACPGFEDGLMDGLGLEEWGGGGQGQGAAAGNVWIIQQYCDKGKLMEACERWVYCSGWFFGEESAM